jgi:hypothetical protein
MKAGARNPGAPAFRTPEIGAAAPKPHSGRESTTPRTAAHVTLPPRFDRGLTLDLLGGRRRLANGQVTPWPQREVSRSGSSRPVSESK